MSNLEDNREQDGFIWCYELSSDHLALKLFQCLPLGRIRLSNVVYVRQRSAGDLAAWWRDFFLKPFRSWYWPHPVMSHKVGHSTPYIIRTRSGNRIYVRLRGGFHYRLRDAIGKARLAKRVKFTAVQRATISVVGQAK